MFPLNLTIKPSRLIVAGVGGLGLVVAGGVMFTDTPWWFRLSVAVLALGESFRQMAEHGWRKIAKSVVAVTWADVFEWRIHFRRGEAISVSDVRVEMLTPFIITLSVPGRWALRKKIWLAKDAVGDDAFRQLTTGLKLLEQANAGH